MTEWLIAAGISTLVLALLFAADTRWSHPRDRNHH